jgi:hypothetical protein
VDCDVDFEVDSEDDTDSETDCDVDWDSEPETDWDTESDADSEAEVDSETDSSMEIDVDPEVEAEREVETEKEFEMDAEGLGGCSGCPIVAANELARAVMAVGIRKPKRLRKKLFKGVWKLYCTCTTIGSRCRLSGTWTSMSAASTSVSPSGRASSVV